MRTKFSINSFIFFIFFLIFSYLNSEINVPNKTNNKPLNSDSVVIDLGKISSKMEKITIYKCFIETKDTNVENVKIREIVKNLFATHGSFSISEDMKNSDFVFKFWQDQNKMLLNFEVFKNNQLWLSGNKTGTNSLKNICLSADKIVEHILQKPGFFSGKLAFIGNKSEKNLKNSNDAKNLSNGKDSNIVELYISDILLSDVKKITSNQSQIVMPRWHPNSRDIICTMYLDGFPNIYKIDTQNLNKQKIASYRGVNSGGNFSPSGDKIAMILSDGKIPELYISNSNGQNLKKLTTDKSIKASPIWSPDGKTIIYTSDLLNGTGKPQLYEIPSSGGQPKRIITNISRNVSEPNWNPFYTNLICFTAMIGSNFQIGVYDFETKQTDILTNNKHDCLESRWLNDGRHIIYTARSSQNKKMCIFDTITKKETVISKQGLENISEISYIYEK